MKKNRQILFISIIAVITFSLWQAKEIQAQNETLTFKDIITALNTKYPNKSFKTKAEAIKYIISQVKLRRFERELSAEMEEILRQAGATDELIEAIKNNSLSKEKPQSTKIETLKNSIGMEFVSVPSGSFMMGSSLGERNDAAKVLKQLNPLANASWFSFEGPVRKVTIDYDFYLGKYEVTIGEWLAVMGKYPVCNLNDFEAKFVEDNRQPIVCVSWDKAKEFIQQLNARDEDFEYRLPSEAEWEYAARAGTSTAFAFGNTLLTSQANFKGDEFFFRNVPKGVNLEKTVVVGSYQPNKWGLYDMHGNASEWVEDYSTRDSNLGYKGLISDGSPNLKVGFPEERMVRGGDWGAHGHDVRSATRFAEKHDLSRTSSGFRLVISRIKRIKAD